LRSASSTAAQPQEGWGDDGNWRKFVATRSPSPLEDLVIKSKKARARDAVRKTKNHNLYKKRRKKREKEIKL
jgi:Zn-finger nucleic acid-binding protein